MDKRLKRKLLAIRTVRGILVREIDPLRLCPVDYSITMFEPATHDVLFTICADPTIDRDDLKMFVEAWYLSELESRWLNDTLFTGRSPEPKREPNGELGQWGWGQRYE